MLLGSLILLVHVCVCHSAMFAVRFSPWLSITPQVLASNYGLNYIGPVSHKIICARNHVCCFFLSFVKVGSLQGVHLVSTTASNRENSGHLNMSAFASDPGVSCLCES